MFPRTALRLTKPFLSKNMSFSGQRNRSFLAKLKNYSGPTRIERDTIGEMAVPVDCLWGAQTQR